MHVCSRCQEERSLDTSRQLSQENKLSALSASTSYTFSPPPPQSWQRYPTATLSLPEGRTGTPGAVLTNAVTQGGPVEARLAAHDTTVRAQAVLAPPCAADGISIFFTLIHICREKGQGVRMVRQGSCLLTAAPEASSVGQRP